MKRILTLQFFLLTVNIAFSQTLNQKWEQMLDKAESYQNYKVIKKTELTETWNVVRDSIARVRKELMQERGQIAQQQDQIEQLQKQNAEIKAKLDTVSLAKDNIAFLGVQVDKYTYTTLLWVVIGIIFAGAGVLFYLFNNSNVVTQQKIREYDELFNSFEEYKKNTIEKERKLKRELQTQLNTIEELKSRPTRV